MQKYNLQTSLGSVFEKTSIWAILWEAKEDEKAREICAAEQKDFPAEEWRKSLVSCPETGYPYICRDNCPLFKSGC